MTLVDAWAAYDDQCLRRERDRNLPTPEITGRVLDLTGELAERVGVTGTDLRVFMNALRRGGWDRAEVVAGLVQLASRRAVLAGTMPPAVAAPPAASDGTPSVSDFDPDNAT